MPRVGKGGWAWQPLVSQQTGAVGQGVQLGRAGPGYPGPSVLATEVQGGGCKYQGRGVCECVSV